MSVSKWAYEPDKCDGDYCVGDCDFCRIKTVKNKSNRRNTKWNSKL